MLAGSAADVQHPAPDGTCVGQGEERRLGPADVPRRRADVQVLRPSWSRGTVVVRVGGRASHAVSFQSRVIDDGNSLSRQYVYVNTICLANVVVYTRVVPNLWNETIEAHRATVRDAILDTTAALVTEHGLRSATMSQIAKKTGIGRATLYKYFPDVEAILLAWHERQITGHLEHLAELRDQASDAAKRLEAVLEAYAFISHNPEHHGTELAALLHRGKHV